MGRQISHMTPVLFNMTFWCKAVGGMTAIQKMQQASKSALLSYLLHDRVPRELVGTTGAERYTLASVCLHALALFSSARCSSGLQVLAPPTCREHARLDGWKMLVMIVWPLLGTLVDASGGRISMA